MDANAEAQEEKVIKDLQKKMLNGQKDVIKYLQSLPQAQADKIRWKLVKSLERISQRSNGKKAAEANAKESSAHSQAASHGQGQGAAGSQHQPLQHSQSAGSSGQEATGKEASKKGQLILNRYQVGEAIGKGGFATVYRALDTERGDFVAIKQIEKRLLASDQLPKIMQEAELLKKLSHPNVVGFRASVETPKHIHFVLEFVEGGSLYRVVKKFGTFTEKLCAIYMRQVLMGLAYLHDQGVVHRDIKGGNLLLTKEGQVKLADFGACTYTALNKNLTVVGTPFWMAPEIIEMSEGAGTPADIWSLGCTVLELLTGSPPYFHLGTMQALFKMVEDPHPPLPAGSAELKEFLLQCFNKDFRRRAPAKQLMTHKWIVSNASTGAAVKKEELEGTLKSLNNVGAKGASSALAASSKQRLQAVKHSLKEMRTEQQALQLEIVEARKQKQQLEEAIAKLKQN